MINDVLGSLSTKHFLNSVYSENIEGRLASEQTITLNTSSFNNGVYVYTLSSNENKLVGRLLINK